MIPLAHVGGVPLEELLPSGAALLMARAWLTVHLRRQKDAGT
jgi:hypothetical protein